MQQLVLYENFIIQINHNIQLYLNICFTPQEATRSSVQGTPRAY